MRKILFLLFAIHLYGVETEVVHSSVVGYFESKTYKNSKQKEAGKVYGIGGDIHYFANEFRFVYENGAATTKKPPLDKDLKNEKIFFRYRYTKDRLSFYGNYLRVLHDNIAITSGGDGYGIGVGYKIDDIALNFTQYMVMYNDFKTYQSDIKLEYKTNFDAFKVKFTLLDKYISLDDKQANIFTKNAKKSYNTFGIKLHTHYKSYHLGGGAFFGKRVFAIMNDGFKLQHHAMEFSKTYAIGIGKTLKPFIARVQYIYQKAKELPIQNDGVVIKNMRFIFNYKF